MHWVRQVKAKGFDRCIALQNDDEFSARLQFPSFVPEVTKAGNYAVEFITDRLLPRLSCSAGATEACPQLRTVGLAAQHGADKGLGLANLRLSGVTDFLLSWRDQGQEHWWLLEFCAAGAEDGAAVASSLEGSGARAVVASRAVHCRCTR